MSFGGRPPPPPPPPALPRSPSNACDPKNIVGALLMVPQERPNNSNEQLRRNLKVIIENDIPNLSSKILMSSNKFVRPILQDGPCCGVVALAMASQILNKETTPRHIFETSKNNGLSLQGELFSAYDMATLAKKTLDCTTAVLDMKDFGSRDSLLRHLAEGHPVLVPYDGDANNGPCLKNGNKAHWTLLTGILFSQERTLQTDNLEMMEDNELSPLYLVTPEQSTVLQELVVSSSDVFVYGVQGKSQYVGLWSLDRLLDSNANLREVDPDREAEVDRYIIPQEGIQQVLCHKIVVLQN